MPITEPIDEDELEAELGQLEQESLDEKMLKTGTVPVADSLSRAPKVVNGEGKSLYSPLIMVHERIYIDNAARLVKGKTKAPVEEEDDEEEELRKLQAEMAM